MEDEEIVERDGLIVRSLFIVVFNDSLFIRSLFSYVPDLDSVFPFCTLSFRLSLTGTFEMRRNPFFIEMSLNFYNDVKPIYRCHLKFKSR